MIAANRLAAFLDQRPLAGGRSVVGWRLEVVQSESLRVGIRDSLLGGPYEGPGVALALVAALELHWSDGRLTRTSADRRALADPAACCEEWSASAVPPREGRLPPLPEQTSLPTVETYDDRVAMAVRTEPDRALALLARLDAAAHDAGHSRTDAVLRASVSRRAVRSSRGFDATWEETACSLQLWLDELGGATYERRAWPDEEQVGSLHEQASILARSLRNEAPVPTRTRGVLFAPDVVESLIERFLLPNLGARTIREGRSLFRWDDLIAKQRVVRDDLGLVIDTTVPLSLATAPCSPEGVPADRVALIEEGRLQSPIVDVEQSAAVSLPPTPRPRGRPYALLTSSRPVVPWDVAIRLLGDGVIVRSLPGLHTQAARRASYALVTPDAEAVTGGVRAGRCSIRLAGSLIDHVSQPSSRVVRIPGVPGHGLLVLDGVTVSPA